MIKKYIRFFIFTCICFILADIFVNADTYNVKQFSAQLYDNTNGSLSVVNTTLDNSMEIYYGYVSWSGSNASGGAWGVSSPIPLIANHTYSMTVSAPVSGCGTTALSSYNRIGVGTTLAGAVSSYQGNSYVSENYSRAINNYMLQFVFTPSINGSYIVFPYASSSSCSGPASHLENIVIDDLGSGGVSETTINSSLNNQTNIINSSISSSEANLRSAINQSTEDISNSIDLSNYNCMKETTKKDFHFGKEKYVENDGTLRPTSNYYYTTDFIRVTGTTITFSGINGNNYHLTFFDKDYNIIGAGSILQSTTYNLPSGTYYIKFSLNKDNYNNFTLSSDSCIYVDKNISTDNAINDVNDTLNDDDTTGATGEASDFFSSFSTDTFGLTSIITAPLNLIQSLTSSTCTALHIPLPYLNNKYIDLPCMTSIYQSTFGSFFTMYQTITFGIIAYWVCVRIFNQVKDFKNPEHDEIEVLDL